jgi:hypothetical protein
MASFRHRHHNERMSTVTLRRIGCEYRNFETYEGVSKSFRTSRQERELQMVQLSTTRCSCVAILWVSIVSFAAITLCVLLLKECLLLLFISLSTQSGNFWIHPRIAPRIPDLGTGRRWVVSFTPRPLYLQANSPWYPLDRRLGGPQSRFGHSSG